MGSRKPLPSSKKEKENSSKYLSRTLGQLKHPNSDVSPFKNFRIRVFQLSTSKKPPNLQILFTGPALPYLVLLKSLIWASFKISKNFAGNNGGPCFYRPAILVKGGVI